MTDGVASLLAGTRLEIIPGATAAGLAAGALLPLLGLWVVLQRVVFLGVTLAQVAAAGVALGLFLHLPPLACGAALCAALVLWFTRGRRAAGAGAGIGATGDATLGAAFCAASAMALLFVSRSPVELDQVHHVLHGNLIYADPADVRLTLSALLAGLVVTAVCIRPMLFCAFDPETAAALGLSPRRWMFLLFGVLAVVLSVSTRTTGSLLSFALLILPPLAALPFGRGLLGTAVLSSLLGVVGTLAGLLLAVGADLHLESSITLGVFAMLPLGHAWGRHPLLGAATAAALLAALLAVTAERPGHDHTSTLGRGGHVETASPYELVVHLEHGHREGREVVVDWSFDLHRLGHDVAHGDGTGAGAGSGAGPGAGRPAALPPAFWLVLSAGGETHELPLVADTAALSPGPVARRGQARFAVTGEAPSITGQVWSGPLDGLDSLPVDHAHVQACAVD